jgi:hypothetical protein
MRDCRKMLLLQTAKFACLSDRHNSGETIMIRGLTLFTAAAMVVALSSQAVAKPARCFTSDDGYFNCDFQATDRAGSFTIRARGKPVYSLIVEKEGFAAGYLRMNGRSIPLNGSFVRQRDDGACWSNPELNVKICAW